MKKLIWALLLVCSLGFSYVMPYGFIASSIVAAEEGGDFSPSADVSGLELWYDADDAATIGLTGSDVDTWDDKSDGGHDGTDDDYKPTYKPALLNGKAGIHFDRGSNGAGLQFSALNVTQPCTMFTVISVNGTSTTHRLMWKDASNYWQYSGTNARIEIKNTGELDSVNFSRDVDPTGAMMTTTIFRDADMDLYTRVGDFEGYDTHGGNLTWDGIGYQYGQTNATIFEILIYDNELSAGDITSVQEYLEDKWGSDI